jgi:hypothetical protein
MARPHAPSRQNEPTFKSDGQCYAPGCERAGVCWVGALFLCENHARTWPTTWGQLQSPPEDVRRS